VKTTGGRNKMEQGIVEAQQMEVRAKALIEEIKYKGLIEEYAPFTEQVEKRKEMIKLATSYWIKDNLPGELYFSFNGNNDNKAILREQPFGGESILLEIVRENGEFILKDYYSC